MSSAETVRLRGRGVESGTKWILRKGGGRNPISNYLRPILPQNHCLQWLLFAYGIKSGLLRLPPQAPVISNSLTLQAQPGPPPEPGVWGPEA